MMMMMMMMMMMIIIIIIIIMVGQTKIENFMDYNLNDFFFSLVSNKLIFILLVYVLYSQI